MFHDFEVPPVLPSADQHDQEVIQLRIHNEELKTENEALKTECKALR